VKVLVVEDAHRLADGIAEGLRDEAMAVDVAYDGLEALAKLNLNHYDVVVLDRDLPGLHGDDVCRTITEHQDRVMVLMLTASDAPLDRVSGLRLGADDYLAKPFNFDELVLRVRGLARRKPTAHTRLLEVADITLDPLQRVVTRRGTRLNLSLNEYQVLEALMRVAPAPLSAEALLRQVWDEHADPFTKTVHVTISRLRRKLGKPDPIETLTRVGYRIPDAASESTTPSRGSVA
jgi:DNA-binding response OmpR family regulator